MTRLEILVKAKERINKPSKWCKYWSVSKDRRRVCAMTAISWAAGCDGRLSRYSAEALDALHALAAVSGVNPHSSDLDRLVYVNGTSHRAVMEMFDRAIAAKEAGEP